MSLTNLAFLNKPCRIECLGASVRQMMGRIGSYGFAPSMETTRARTRALTDKGVAPTYQRQHSPDKLRRLSDD
jgi:hypothetical protein